MAVMHFISKEWWIDIFGDNKPALRLNGKVENFSLGKEIEASVNVFHKIDSILENLENYSALLDETENVYVERLKELLNNGHACGIVHLWEVEKNQEELLHIDLMIPKEAYDELWRRTTNPLPACIMSFSVIEEYSQVLRTNKFCTAISASISLKYSN